MMQKNSLLVLLLAGALTACSGLQPMEPEAPGAGTGMDQNSTDTTAQEPTQTTQQPAEPTQQPTQTEQQTTQTPQQPNTNVSGPPQQVLDHGYSVRTFRTEKFSSANVDLQNTGNPSFQWFLRDPTVWQGVSPADILKFHEDGSLSVAGRISTVFSGYSVEPWHGSAFGGGAYFEATLSFDPDAVNTDPGGGFPAWWGQPIEHWALSGSGADWWKGKGDWFVHYAETDFMEYAFVDGSKNHYWGSTIDWSGAWNNQTGYPGIITNYSVAKIEVPADNDFNKPHRYGYLWVPATDTTKGYFQYFFDGMPTSDRVEYSKYDCDNPPSNVTANSPYLFGVLDCQHQVLVMNASPRAPLRVYSVEVWQGPGRKVLAQ